MGGIYGRNLYMPDSYMKASRKKPVLGTYKRPTPDQLQKQLKTVTNAPPTDYYGKLDFYNNKYPRFGGMKSERNNEVCSSHNNHEMNFIFLHASPRHRYLQPVHQKFIFKI